jgi:hypothetical protein
VESLGGLEKARQAEAGRGAEKKSRQEFLTAPTRYFMATGASMPG